MRGWIVYARSTTIQAQPSSIDAGIAHLRDEVMPALQAIDGCVGVSLLADRESGRCVATSAWETEDAMRASAGKIQPIRDRAAKIFGGSPTVEEWEIAALHRDHRSHDGACVRATWVTGDPPRMDENVEYYKTAILPELENLEGFCSASLMIDRASGRAVSCASFDSREAMERNSNREQSTALKNAKLQEAGAKEVDEREFDLALAHLRAPELA
jgi:Antibiotic biosynthesis monooxygenase